MHSHTKHIGFHRRTAKNGFCKKHRILATPAVFVSERMSGFRAQIFPVSEGNKVFLSSNVRFRIDTGF